MTTATPTRAVIIGCGVIGTHHARVLAAHEAFTVSALVDVFPEALSTLADLLPAEYPVERPRTFATLTEALEAGDIDLVVITTPSGLHVDAAREALAAGVHVVIEKPIDVDLVRARRIADLADEAAERGLMVSVISQHRFDPASVLVKQAIDEGRFGRVTSGSATVAWWRGQDYYDSGNWRGTWELDGGGAVMNQGVHTVDLLRWTLGTPVEIYARTALLAHERIEVEDIAVATVAFESGALGVIHCTTAAYPGLNTRLQVLGSRGSAVIDNDRLEYFHAAGGADLIPGTGLSAVGTANQAAEVIDAGQLSTSPRAEGDFLAAHTRQYDDIAAALRDGRDPGITARDATHSLALVHAMYASATLGTAVLFADVLAGKYDDLTLTTGRAS
ncbi:Gfo/Idh/MocA family protein [Mycetocola sp. JXN-3]|uniref:Gfo/Idh/MocA family protein n=1 Tax=Mycetocola sp. JXN-3 TaxID=2116510 RepID=UPI00165D149D|nr:Gfo/Idh/MocA family oxidoreductase [Mycetocola sp. JXN-3]